MRVQGRFFSYGKILQFIGMTMLPSALLLGLTQENAVRQELFLFFLGCAVFLAGTLWLRRNP